MSKPPHAVSLLVLLITLLPLHTAMAQGGRASAQRGTTSSPLDPDDPFASPGMNGISAQISGTVRTFDGHGVPNAEVVARDLERASVLLNTHSDSNGHFTLRGLQPGSYEVTVTSGLEQASERVNVSSSGDFSADFRFSGRAAAGDSKASSVSLSQYKVPGKARSLYEKASQLLVHGKADQSLEKVNAALAAYPQFSEALTLRGVIEERAGKAVEAMSDYRKAVEYDANYTLAYVAQASLLNSAGRFVEAVPILEQASRLSPELWQIPFEMSRSCLGRGDFKAAMSNVDRASQLRGGPQNDLPAMHLLRGYIFAGLSNLQRATEEIQAYLTHQPNGPSADAARRALEQMRGSTISASR